MYRIDKILVGKNEETESNILLNKASRHGLITGASGTGKTITLKVLAEGFADAGVPVFLVDVKGDLAGMPFYGNEKSTERAQKMKIDDFTISSFASTYYDILGEMGHPIRTTVSDLGASFISKLLDLSDTQESVLTIVFKIAKDNNKEIRDLEDLRQFLILVNDNRKELSTQYGALSTTSLASIQRNILSLSESGADKFFGKPSFDIMDFMKFDPATGNGYINILDATNLFKYEDTYVIVLLWLLTTLYNTMPEVGEVDKPKLVFFFDEAHLIFENMPNHIIKQVTQIVKLIRSKGIGLYFISQTPSDIPDEILGQLGNRIQHALRCYTKSDEKVVKAAADSYRSNKDFDTFKAIQELETGEALVSFLTETGEPSIVERVKILPPQSRMGTITPEERNELIKSSRLFNKYDNKDTSESGISNLNLTEAKEEVKEDKNTWNAPKYDTSGFIKKEEPKKEEPPKKTKKSALEKTTDKVVNSAANTIGRKIGNSIFKNIFK